MQKDRDREWDNNQGHFALFAFALQCQRAIRLSSEEVAQIIYNLSSIFSAGRAVLISRSPSIVLFESSRLVKKKDKLKLCMCNLTLLAYGVNNSRVLC